MQKKKYKSQTIKFWTINGLSPCTVAVREISTLNHELFFFFLGLGFGKVRITELLIAKKKKSNAHLE